MKTRLLSLFLALGMMLTFLPARTVTVFATGSSEKYTDGSYQFTINADNTATITGYTGFDVKITIPAKVTQDGQEYPVTKIGDGVFRNYIYTLAEVYLPETITEIGDDAFNNCTSLVSIAIQDDKSSHVKKIGNRAFMYCNSLTDIFILDSVTEIGSEAFQSCESLKTITIPKGVTSIEDYTFYLCYGLNSVTLPSTVTAIGENAFAECPFLETITSDSEIFPVKDNVLYEKSPNGGYALLRYPSRKGDPTFEIPDCVTKIGNSALDFCVFLESVRIPNSVVSIGSMAFIGCESLKTVEFSGSHSQWDNISMDLELPNVAITHKSIDVTVNSDIRTVTAKVDGRNVPINDGQFAATIGKEVELTVSDPQYRDVYTWTGGNGTVSADGKTYTFVAGSDDTTVTLTTVEHTTYDAGDFIITGLMDYTYGDEIDIKIESKDASVANYIVKYIQDAGTLDEKEFEELPQDAGIYTLRIIQGDTVIDIPEKFIIQPAAVTNETLQDEFTLILPEGAVESDGIDYAAKITVNSDSRLKALLQSAEVKIELIYIDDAGEEVSTPTKAGRYTVKAKITSSTPNLASTVVDGGSFEIYQKAAPIAPAASLYPLTIKNADVVIKYSGDEIQTEKNEVGDQVARVPENADVTITYTSQSDAIVFDQWVASGLGDSVDVSQNPLTFQMPANEKGVTVEAMTKDASIEDGGSSILGTVVVVGASAVLAWQGCRIGTMLYLKSILPDGAVIPTNITELAELMWNNAGKPVPTAVLSADATDAQKALVWATENRLLPSGKTSDASVNRIEVIQSWRKAQELKS